MSLTVLLLARTAGAARTRREARTRRVQDTDGRAGLRRYARGIDDPPRILLLCAANQCRAPMAAWGIDISSHKSRQVAGWDIR
ncbi:MAG: hypothetical protein MUP97_14690 [Acidimicrobiia bacterium]|nr:hypothetical protein [Acidimicrobiia bacterium]